MASDDESLNELIEEEDFDEEGQTEQDLAQRISSWDTGNHVSSKFAGRISEVVQERIRARNPLELLQFFSRPEMRMRFKLVSFTVRGKKRSIYRDVRTGKFVSKGMVLRK